MALLEVKSFSKVYRKTKAVADLNLVVSAGEFVGLIGPNGAGKSTTLKSMAGMIEPTTGQILIEGFDVLKDEKETNQRTGYVEQNPRVFPFLTGEEYLRFMGESRGLSGKKLSNEVESLLKLSELTSARDRLIREYSGGMEQKTAICGALMGAPPLLLLDESFVGLDPESTFAIQERLMEHCKNGGAVILSSHILPMLENMCTRFLFMKRGNLVEDLPSERFLQRRDAGEFSSLLEMYMRIKMR